MNPWMSLVAAIAVLGFAMIFSVPRTTLPTIMVLSVAAHLTRSIILELGGSLPLASFLAALLIGTTAAFLSPRLRKAKPIYAFAPVIPLIPGTFMFNTLTGLLTLAGSSSLAPEEMDALAVSVLVDGATATLTVIALAVGAIGPTLLAGHHINRLFVPTALDDAAEDALD